MFLNDIYFKFIMLITGLLPDIMHVLKLRGFLLRPCFKKCGTNLQVTKDVRLYNCGNIEIGNDVFFSAGVWLLASARFIIEDEVMFGPYCVALTGDHTKVDGSFRFGKAKRESISIGRGSWLGAHCVVTKGVTIGSGCVIGACSVVTKNIENDVLAAGSPAKKIKNI